MTFSFHGVHVLLVGNNQHMRRLLRTILASSGADEIREARDGQEAIEAARLDPPGLIIAEWSMGPMNGLEMTRYIRRSQKSPAPHAPIILLTGAGVGGDLQAVAREAGVSETIAKPLHAEVLLASIDRLLPTSR
ncbi:response regulator [Telmatospirillum siberiense]|nr:response regulator [Telmatospirillum siberiense]